MTNTAGIPGDRICSFIERVERIDEEIKALNEGKKEVFAEAKGQAPAVRGHSVCRMHGAAGGAPRGNRNALKHGARSAETLALKRQISALARLARETLEAME